MAVLTKEELTALAQNQDSVCVSILMPVHLEGQETRQAPIRFKNLLHQAELKLVDGGMRRPEAATLMQPADHLVSDYDFWQHQEHGLAVFICPHEFRSYRVPLTLDDQVVLNNRFYIKPLLPLIENDGRFYILALSQDSIRFFEATRHTVGEVELEGIPRNIKEALPGEVEEKVGQVHAGTFGLGQRRKNQGVFTGQGDIKDVYKNNILRFFQKVDAGLYKKIVNDDAPLVLAGVEYLHPIYREANHYAHLVDEGIVGNPDDWKPVELHERAWPLVEPLFQEGQKAAADLYRQYAGEHNGLASANLQEIIPAAIHGRVDTLFVALGKEKWGRFDPKKQTVELHPAQEKGDEDLLNLAAVHTYLNDGAVYAVPADQVPSGKAAAAIFRYRLT